MRLVGVLEPDPPLGGEVEQALPLLAHAVDTRLDVALRVVVVVDELLSHLTHLLAVVEASLHLLLQSLKKYTNVVQESLMDRKIF